MPLATRLQKLPPYLFARIEQKIAEAKARGEKLISLGIGDPDSPSPDHIVRELQIAATDPANHQYPSSVGLLAFRQAVASWYARRHGVELDPHAEVVTLIGSKEGIAHLPLCYLNPGDISLVPDPAYPVYKIGTILAGGEPYPLPLTSEHGFRPDLAAVPAEVARKAKLLFLNYPNNPTAAVANREFFQEVITFARDYDILVAHDAAYAELTFDGYVAPSFLELPGAREVGIEFGSLSKPYNMTGWRLGWAAGNPEVIAALARLKSNIDSGAFQAVQQAGIAALTGTQDSVEAMRQLYSRRRDILVDGLNRLGWHLNRPQATFYVWAPVPRGYTSAEFAEDVLERAGVIVTPGNEYGEAGEGYFRASLTVADASIVEALDRLRHAFGRLEVD